MKDPVIFLIDVAIGLVLGIAAAWALFTIQMLVCR